MLVNNHEGTRPRVHRLSFFKAWMQAEDEGLRVAATAAQPK